MEKCRVSVVIPVYNVEKYLRQCLDSIVKQTLKNIEIICVNDGSTDNGPKILEEYAKLDARVVIINKKNAGLGAARNTGLDAAHGEYVCFVDSDDFIDKALCEKITKVGIETKADVIFFDVGLYYSASAPLGDFANSDLYEELAKTGTFSIKDAPEIQQNHSVWSRAYRREFLLENNLRNPEQRFGEDMLYTYMTSVYAKKMAAIPEKLYFYRQNRKGSLLEEENHNNDYKMMYVSSMRDTKEFLKKTGAYEYLKEDFLKSRIRWAVPRQIGIHDKAVFYDFFCQISEMLTPDDYEVLEQPEYLNQFPEVREYLSYLKRKKARRYYALIKWRRVYQKEYTERRFRIPHTMIVFRIPRLHHFWRVEMMDTRYELRVLQYETRVVQQRCNDIINENHELLLQNRELLKLLTENQCEEKCK